MPAKSPRKTSPRKTKAPTKSRRKAPGTEPSNPTPPFTADVSHNTLVHGEGSRQTLLQFDPAQTDEVKARNAAMYAHIYMSPVFASVRDCVILTGDAAEKYKRREEQRRALSHVGSAIRNFALTLWPRP